MQREISKWTCKEKYRYILTLVNGNQMGMQKQIQLASADPYDIDMHKR